MHHELALLIDRFDRHESHVWAGDGFADGGCIGCIVLAATAREAVRDDELGRHQAYGVAELLELARPLVGARAGFHADEARRQRGDEFEQLGARHARAHQHALACGIHAVNSKDVLGEIDSDGDNGRHGPLLPQNE